MRIWITIVAAALVLTACQTTAKKAEPTTQAGRYGRIVVLAVRMPLAARQAAESSMAAALQQRGAQAIMMSQISPPGADKTAKAMVARVLDTGARAVFVLDPFVFRQNGKPVVKSVILSGLNFADPNEVVPAPPITYKAAIYDVENLRRAWIDDINSRDQGGKHFNLLAGQAGEDAVAKAVAAKAF